MSNKELREKISDLAAKHSKELPTDFEKLNHGELEALLDALEKLEAPPPPAAAVAVAAPGGPRYFVPAGKSLSCKRGVLEPGEEVFPTDLTGVLNNVAEPTPAQLLEAQNKHIEHLAGRGHLSKR